MGSSARSIHHTNRIESDSSLNHQVPSISSRSLAFLIASQQFCREESRLPFRAKWSTKVNEYPVIEAAPNSRSRVASQQDPCPLFRKLYSIFGSRRNHRSRRRCCPGGVSLS